MAILLVVLTSCSTSQISEPRSTMIPRPSNTPRATAIPLPAAALLPTATHQPNTPQKATESVLLTVPATPTTQASVARNANLREGPGTSFAIVGGMKAGESLTIVARNEKGDWYRLAGGSWIAASLVTGAPALGAIEIEPVSPPPTSASPAKPPTASPVVVQRAAPSNSQGYVCEACIAGNINNKDEKIYHFPGCPDYGRVKIDTDKGERWFNSEEEARAAGWRKSLNCP